MYYFKTLYIYFIILALILFFFSTTNVKAKAFKIENIEISKPFQNDFDKKEIINIGFKKAFFELTTSLLKQSDQKKVDQIKLNEIKGMIESFSIKEEKFIEQVYFVNLGVSFNKKKIFSYLENKNIFPSIPIKESFLFIPIIIDENVGDLIVFTNNPVLKSWNNNIQSSTLIKFILPTEDLEDFNLIKSKYEFLENYDFKQITNKYFLKNSIISLIFKDDKGLRVLSKISIGEKKIIKNKFYQNFDLNNNANLSNFITEQKQSYEDIWKEYNQINTSIKLPLTIRVNNKDQIKLSEFEIVLEEMDLVYDFLIQKFNKDYIFYEVIYNGTPKTFLEAMRKKKFDINTQKKIWILK